jgi:transcriptional regulator with XRE-family HTH domain
MSLVLSIKLNVLKKLKEDKAYRERFFRGQAADEIAISIRSLREKRGETQTDLAKKADMKQSAISRIEQADYYGWTFRTLFRVADALDARLRVIFEPAETVIANYERREEAQLNDRVANVHIATAIKMGMTEKDLTIIEPDSETVRLSLLSAQG